jgi:hypothetical protein
MQCDEAFTNFIKQFDWSYAGDFDVSAFPRAPDQPICYQKKRAGYGARG